MSGVASIRLKIINLKVKDMYNCNSKVEVRAEAIRIAQMTMGTTALNIIDVAKQIEAYIIGDANLPELYDPNANIKEMADIWKNAFASSQQKADENWQKIMEQMQARQKTDEVTEADFETVAENGGSEAVAEPV